MTKKSSSKPFALLLLSVLVSVAGVRIADFAIGLWVLHESGSTAIFSMVSFIIFIPGVLLSPLLGLVVDRLHPGRLIIYGCSGAGVCTMLMGWLYVNEQLALWSIAVLGGLGSVCSALVYQAFLAEKSLGVEHESAARRQGSVQGGFAIVQILSPTLAAFLLVSYGMGSIFVMHVLACLFALTLLVFCYEQKVGRLKRGQVAGGWRESIWVGLSFLRENSTLASLLLFLVILNFFFGMTNFLLTPLVLSMGGEEKLGGILSVAGLGMLCGGVIVSVMGLPRAAVKMMQGLALIMAACFMLTFWFYLHPQRLLLIGFTVFVVAVSYSVLLGINQIVWMTLVPDHILGRVFGWRFFCMQLSFPLGMLVSGPLAEYAVKPTMKWFGSVQEVDGPGGLSHGLEVPLVYLVTGVVLCVVVLVMRLKTPILNADWVLSEKLNSQKATAGCLGGIKDNQGA
ncbi:MFS transporter [Pseudomonas frederiksbergensis]|uniref:MFS transporter n=1 Tax=Pseudomonas frederiksbergensis TaxID=104087 RepID=UPI003D22D867